MRKLSVILTSLLLCYNVASAAPPQQSNCGMYTFDSPMDDPFDSKPDVAVMYERVCGKCMVVNYTQFEKVSCNGQIQMAIAVEVKNKYQEVLDEDGSCIPALVRTDSRHNEIVENCPQVCGTTFRNIPFFYELKKSHQVDDYELCSTAAAGSQLIKSTIYKPDSITTRGGCDIPWAISSGGYNEKVYSPSCLPNVHIDDDGPDVTVSPSPSPSPTASL